MPPKRKLPVWVTKSLECPVCLATIKDPPIFQCEKGHGLCQTCREPLKAENKPCPVCRGRLTDTRNLAVENMLDQLPKIKCKYEGCAFQKADCQLVKTHEEEECRERPVKCEICQEPVALSKLGGHLETKHNRQPIRFGNLGVEQGFHSGTGWRGSWPFTKVNNDLQFIFNWRSYDAKVVMFWISLCGTPKEAKEYEYSIKIESSADRKAGRTKFLLAGTGDCLSCEVSHQDVKDKATEVMLFSQAILNKAAEENDDPTKLKGRLMIQKKKK